MNRNRHGEAFTLVELLVVIAIIGILAALLLSALSASKHQAQDVKCVNNLKQMTLSGLMYMDDTGETIVEYDTNDLNSWVQSLNPYGLTTKIILCPATCPTNRESSNNAVAGTASLAWYVWPPTTTVPVNGSYSMNSWLNSYDPNITIFSTWIAPPPPVVSNNPQYIFSKPASVQRPAMTPFFTDSVFWNEWPLESDPPASDLSTGASIDITGMQRCTIWRHGGGTATSPTPVRSVILPPYYIFPNNAAINIGFDDGHAEAVRLASLWSLYWHYNWKPPPR